MLQITRVGDFQFTLKTTFSNWNGLPPARTCVPRYAHRRDLAPLNESSSTTRQPAGRGRGGGTTGLAGRVRRAPAAHKERQAKPKVLEIIVYRGLCAPGAGMMLPREQIVQLRGSEKKPDSRQRSKTLSRSVSGNGDPETIYILREESPGIGN